MDTNEAFINGRMKEKKLVTKLKEITGKWSQEKNLYLFKY